MAFQKYLDESILVPGSKYTWTYRAVDGKVRKVTGVFLRLQPGSEGGLDVWWLMEDSKGPYKVPFERGLILDITLVEE